MITSISPHLTINTKLKNSNVYRSERISSSKTSSDSFIGPNNNISFNGTVNLKGYKKAGEILVKNIKNGEMISANLYSLSENSSTIVYAIYNDKVLGAMHTSWRIKEKAISGNKKYLELCYLNTRRYQKEYRGVGTKLIEFAKNMSINDSDAKGRIEVLAFKEATGFYKKMGFEFINKDIDAIFNSYTRAMFYQPQKNNLLSSIKNRLKLLS